jgi:hypothetical protein
VYGRMGKTKGFIKPLALGGGMGGRCDVWADGWAEGEGKGGI